MVTTAEQVRNARRARALAEIREAPKLGTAMQTLQRFEQAVRDEDLAQTAGACPSASVTTPSWMRGDLDQRALEEAERRVVAAALALDGATTTETPLEQIISEHNDACQALRRVRRRCARSSR